MPNGRRDHDSPRGLSDVSPGRRQIYTLTLRRVFSYMTERGVPAADLLAGTELRDTDIEDPYHLISENQARLFYRNAVAHSDREGIGLEVGWVSGLSDLGPHGVIQSAVRTVREALNEALENSNFFYLLGDWQARIGAPTLSVIRNVFYTSPTTRG